MSDVIIVLGRGINIDGSLPPDPLSRVRKAVDLYESGHANFIVFSGKWSYHFKEKPAMAESEAMKNYAVSLGVPSNHVIEENESLDTLGNVYFTKKRIVEPSGWSDIIVVASDEHMPRIKYLFNKIYGSEYRAKFECSERVLSAMDHAKELEHERESLDITKKWLDHIEAGSDALVWDLVREHHPAYE